MQGSDWREVALGQISNLVRRADPEIVEEVKWWKPSNPGGVLAWSRHGLLGTGEKYKGKVKVTFAKGASLKDPAGLFNASLEAGTRRAIDLHEGDRLDEVAFVELVREAVAYNKE